MWSKSLAPVTAGARFVVSDNGETLSPKKAPGHYGARGPVRWNAKSCADAHQGEAHGADGTPRGAE